MASPRPHPRPAGDKTRPVSPAAASLPKGGGPRLFRAVVEYDGAGFQGWQSQRVGRTVQQTLAGAIQAVTRESIVPVGAGRTDAGVHAAGQCAHFRSATRIPPERLAAALNAHLPEDVSVVSCRIAPDGFHAQRSALGKIYRYTILNRPRRSPLARGRAWWIRDPLDAEAMAWAARGLQGRHDFRAFCSQASRKENTVRTVRSLTVECDGDFIHCWVEGDGFLYNQVRAMVGTLVEVGRGKRTADDVARILESRDRHRAGATAPAHGLCLMEVLYEQEGWGSE